MTHSLKTVTPPRAKYGIHKLVWADPKSVDDNPRNWRIHDEAQDKALDSLLTDVGWAGAALYNTETRRLIDGHLRKDKALARGEPLPVIVGRWTPDQEALILSTFDFVSTMALTDATKLLSILRDAGNAASQSHDLLDELMANAQAQLAEVERLAMSQSADETDAEKKPNPRILPLDVIYTATITASCCVAVAAGLRYGVQSGKALCPYTSSTPAHALAFVDNDWRAYDHVKHSAVVHETRPKYATTRDLLTKSQAKKEGVAFYSL